MESIKNKQKHKTKILLTSSSLLLLNANQGGCWRLRSQPNQKVVAQNTIDHLTSQNKITKTSTNEPDNTSANEKNQDRGGVNEYESGYESGYESDSENVTYKYKTPVYYPEPSNNVHIKNSDTIPDASKNSKDHSGLQATGNDGTSSDLESSNNIKGRTIGGSKTGESDSGLEKSGSDINEPINDVVKIDPSSNVNTINNYQDKATHSDQGYGSTSNLSSKYTNQPSDEEPEYDEWRLESNDDEDDQSPSNDNMDDPIYATIIETTNPIERTKPIKLITEDLKRIADYVDNQMPYLKKYNLIATTTKIESLVNDMVAMRSGNDTLLTEKQKQLLRSIKTEIKAGNTGCEDVIIFYKQINKDLLTITQKKEKDKQQYYTKAKEIQKKIDKLLNKISNLRLSIPVTDL